MKFQRYYEDVVDPANPNRILHRKNVKFPFEYQQKEINELADSLGLKKVDMVGFYENLKELKEALDNIIGTTDYFFLAHFLGEMAYYWDMNDPLNQRSKENMEEIVNGIRNNMKKVYAYVLAGLGERLHDNEERDK